MRSTAPSAYNLTALRDITILQRTSTDAGSARASDTPGPPKQSTAKESKATEYRVSSEGHWVVGLMVEDAQSENPI